MTQFGCLDAIHGDPLAGDLDHWNPLAITALELGVAGDVDLVHHEAELGGERLELGARPLAEVAVAGDDERDVYG